MVNPDCTMFDIAGGEFHRWRKNRQPTPGSAELGTDINRRSADRAGIDPELTR